MTVNWPIARYFSVHLIGLSDKIKLYQSIHNIIDNKVQLKCIILLNSMELKSNCWTRSLYWINMRFLYNKTKDLITFTMSLTEFYAVGDIFFSFKIFVFFLSLPLVFGLICCFVNVIHFSLLQRQKHRKKS